MADRTATIDLIINEANRERDAQESHFESLDGKAGIVLGFSGVLVAVSQSHSILALLGRLSSACAALMALWAFLPRSLPIIALVPLVELYGGAEAAFVKQRLLEASLSAVGRGSVVLTSKARKVIGAMTALAAAVVLAAGGILARG